jgi:membrane protease YdiL (CAAX protease family)
MQHTNLLEVLSAVTNSARPGRPLASYAYEFLVAGLASFAAAGVVLGLALAFFRRPMRSFLTAAARFRWRAVAAGFVVALPLVAAAFGVERLGDPTPFTPLILTPHAGFGQILTYAATAFACLYLAAFAEEAIFRGWLLQQTAAWTRSLPLILAVNGVAFSLAHFDPAPANFLIRAVMGAGWAWIAIRTAGVEFTTGAHLANNLFVALVVAPVKFVTPPPKAGAYADALIETIVLLAMVAAVEVYLRRRDRRPAVAVKAKASP